MKSRLNVVCLIDHNSALLLGRKAPGVGPYAGCWLIPGGGVNPEKESCDEAMKRETREETGLTVTEFQRLSFGEDIADRHGEMTRLIYLYYKIVGVKSWTVMKPGDDIVELSWFPYQELSSIPLPPVSVILYNRLGYIKNE